MKENGSIDYSEVDGLMFMVQFGDVKGPYSGGQIVEEQEFSIGLRIDYF